MNPRHRTPSRHTPRGSACGGLSPGRRVRREGGALTTGFSLLELLVVLVILGVLATIGVSLNQSPIPASVKAATSSLTGAIRNAQTLALGSGQQIYLRTRGGGTSAPQLEWGFRVPNSDGSLNHLGPVQGAWTLSPAESRFVSIGVGDADLTAADTATLPKAVPAIAMHVQNNTAIWTRAFFTGDPTPTADADCPFFYGTGLISQEFFVTVTGAHSGAVAVKANRMGLIVVSPQSGISAFSKQEPNFSTPPWSRL